MRPTGLDIVKRAIERAKPQGEKLFKGVTILNERPEGMSYQEYRQKRAEQTKARKLL